MSIEGDGKHDPSTQRLSDTVDKAQSRVGDWAFPWVVLAVCAAIGLFVVVCLTAVSAEIYDDVMEGDGVASFDQPVLDKMIEWRTPIRDEWVTHFTDLGSTQILPILTLVAAGLLVWLWRIWTPAVLLAVACAGGLIMTKVGKTAVGRERPDDLFAVAPFETSASFPSGHTMNSWVIGAMVAYLVVCKVRNRLLQILAIVVAVAFGVAMGLSRVYLGHHWLTDVLMSWTLGTAWLIAVIGAHRITIVMLRNRGEDQSSNSTQNSLPSGSSSTT